jgi:hypothetical protein
VKYFFIRNICHLEQENVWVRWKSDVTFSPCRYIRFHHEILLGRSIKEIVVGGACSTHGRGEKRVQGFGGKARRKKTT